MDKSRRRTADHKCEYARADDPQAFAITSVVRMPPVAAPSHARISSPHTNQLQRYQLYSRGVEPAAHKGK